MTAKRIRALLAAICAVSMTPLSAQAPEDNASEDTPSEVPSIALEQLVIDQAGVFSPAFTAAMDARLKSVERDSGTTFVVMTLPGLEGKDSEYLADAALDAILKDKPRPVVGAILLLIPSERSLTYQSQFLVLSKEEAEINALTEEEIARFVDEARAMAERIAPKLSDLAGKHYANEDWEAGTEAIVNEIKRNSRALKPVKRERDSQTESDSPA